MTLTPAPSPNKRHCYDESFKRETVRRLLESGKPVRVFAGENGIEQSVLHRWTKKFRDACGEAPAEGRQRSLDREIHELKREIATIRESVKVLRGVVERSFSERYGFAGAAGAAGDEPVKSAITRHPHESQQSGLC